MKKLLKKKNQEIQKKKWNNGCMDDGIDYTLR